MKINILIPYKEKFDSYKASSVSITISNNLRHSKFLNNIIVFGQQTDSPLFKKNFIGIKYSFLSFKSKNKYLAHKFSQIILKQKDNHQLVEVHNRPYLINQIKKKLKSYPITLFLHNNPKEMSGSKTISERKNLIKKCELILCVSKFVKDQFLDGLKDEKLKVKVLYNGVERKLNKFPQKKKEVLFVGRLVPEKGVDLYVDVIKSIAPKFPEWNFNMIGSEKLGEIDNIKSYAYQVANNFENIGNQTHFYGFKEKKFVEEKMKYGSIMIIPSLWEEPFGLVAAEAMSNGMAIIASRSGGIPEVVKGNAILIKKINYKKLKSALIGLLSDENKMKYFQKKSWENFQLTSIVSSKNLDNFRKKIIKNNF